MSFARDKGHLVRFLPAHTVQLTGFVDLRLNGAVISLLLHGGAGDGQGFGRNRHIQILHVAVCFVPDALRIVPDGIGPGVDPAGQILGEIILVGLARAYGVQHRAALFGLTGIDQQHMGPAVIFEVLLTGRMRVDLYPILFQPELVGVLQGEFISLILARQVSEDSLVAGRNFHVSWSAEENTQLCACREVCDRPLSSVLASYI